MKNRPHTIIAALGRAVELHRKGRLKEAEAEYQAVLRHDSRNSDALNLLGVIAQTRGDQARALDLFNRAVNADPQSAVARFNRANLLGATKNFQAAIEDYRQALTLKADYADAWLNLGALLHTADRLGEATDTFRAMTARFPESAAAHLNLGICLLAVRDFAGAEFSLTRSLSLDARSADSRFALARVYHGTNRIAQAIELLKQAVELAPGNGEFRSTLGTWLTSIGRHDEAIMSHRTACGLDPKRAEFAFNLGCAHHAAGQLQDAENAFRSAVGLDPQFVAAHVNLGQVLADSGSDVAAVECFEQALKIDPANPIAVANHSAAMTNKSLALLGEGRLAEGWAAYRHRFDFSKDAPLRRTLGIAEWRGEPIDDKTLFIWTDQGLGEEIIYASMIPDAMTKAKSCVLECDKRLTGLFKRSFPRAVVASRLSPPAPEISAHNPEVQSSLGDLGGLFRPDFDRFPEHQGYLVADPDKVLSLRERYRSQAAGRPLIGISWRSESLTNGRFKSTPLELWAPILKTPDVCFMSLQYGLRPDELVAARSAAGVDILSDNSFDPMRDLDQFAAQVAAMDLVISVSNTTVHFAGAMNKPVWTLMPRGSGALWYFRRGDKTPWYPSMTFFRQSSPGAWADVIDLVAHSLAGWRRTWRGA